MDKKHKLIKSLYIEDRNQGKFAIMARIESLLCHAKNKSAIVFKDGIIYFLDKDLKECFYMSLHVHIKPSDIAHDRIILSFDEMIELYNNCKEWL